MIGAPPGPSRPRCQQARASPTPPPRRRPPNRRRRPGSARAARRSASPRATCSAS